ncbi:serine hydrolase domain-containing protein [Yoonia sp.]|uniref:serine hydrolase domain-containing protein n=1 Tax=Yoonia sp. TaxID=2212373 RepID=UPI00391CC1BD
MNVRSSRIYALVACTVASLTFGAPGSAQMTTRPDFTASYTTAAPTPEDLEAWLDGFLPYALASADIAGAVVAVTSRDGALLTKGYGVSDIASGAPVHPGRTLFRAGSVSKLFTWTAVMQLVEDGKIDLDEDVQNYIDFSVPSIGRPVTMRDLMTHRAGFSEVLKSMIGDIGNGVPLEQYLRENVPVALTPPGDAAAYSNYGTALAGYIVSRVSGLSFETYVEREIFGPLGMDASTFRQPLPQELSGRLSSGYDRASTGTLMRFEVVVPSPAGALSSSGDDMARFIMAHLAGDVPGLTPETLRLMHTTAAADYPGLDGMTLGFLEQHWGNTRIIGHGGDTQYFHSDLQIFPEQGLGYYIALNSNGTGAASHQLRQALLEGFARRYIGPPPEVPLALDTAVAHGSDVIGTYDTSRTSGGNFLDAFYILGQTQVSMNQDGELLATVLPGLAGEPKRWREVEPWIWQAVDGGERLVVTRKDGHVTGFVMEPFSSIMEFRRVPWVKSIAVLTPVLFISMVVIGLTLVGWATNAVFRRYYLVKVHRSPALRWSRIAAMVSGVAVLMLTGFWIWLFAYALADLSRFSASLDPWLRALHWGTLLSCIAIVSPVWNVGATWRATAPLTAKVWSVVYCLAVFGILWSIYSAGLFAATLNY